MNNTKSEQDSELYSRLQDSLMISNHMHLVLHMPFHGMAKVGRYFSAEGYCILYNTIILYK